MMSTTARCHFACAACLLAFLLVGQPVEAADFGTVVVVSIDALHPDAFTRENAPLTFAMVQEGAVTLRGQSTSPPKTLVAHAAMMTGIGPEQGGRTSNDWAEGEPTVAGRTIFDLARERGYRTGYFYSKPKLGFLVTGSVDASALSPDGAPDEALRFLRSGERAFVFIHVSGLDAVGPEHGWLSPMYIEELSYIDHYLEPVYAYLRATGNYLLIVTSDHGGYGKRHGGDHPDEARLPFGVVSDVCEFPGMVDSQYRVTQLPRFLSYALACEGGR